MLRYFNTMDYDPNSILYNIARQAVDDILIFIDQNVEDQMLKLLLLKKYQHAKRNSTTLRDLQRVMIMHVLPELQQFVNK